MHKRNVVFSDPTDETMWVEGGRYGSIDPCFPAKVAQAHIHNLLFHKHDPEKGRSLNYIFFPILNYIPSFITDTMDNVACPVVSGTPEVMKSAFTKARITSAMLAGVTTRAPRTFNTIGGCCA